MIKTRKKGQKPDLLQYTMNITPEISHCNKEYATVAPSLMFPFYIYKSHSCSPLQTVGDQPYTSDFYFEFKHFAPLFIFNGPTQQKTHTVCKPEVCPLLNCAFYVIVVSQKEKSLCLSTLKRTVSRHWHVILSVPSVMSIV